MRERFNRKFKNRPKLSRLSLACCLGATFDIKTKRGWRISGEFAEVHFNEKELTSSIIVHELIHAVVKFFKRRKLAIPMEDEPRGVYKVVGTEDSEEIFCYMVQTMMEQLVERLTKLKVGTFERTQI
jgi:hypothetical protein